MSLSGRLRHCFADKSCPFNNASPRIPHSKKTGREPWHQERSWRCCLFCWPCSHRCLPRPRRRPQHSFSIKQPPLVPAVSTSKSTAPRHPCIPPALETRRQAAPRSQHARAGTACSSINQVKTATPLAAITWASTQDGLRASTTRTQAGPRTFSGPAAGRRARCDLIKRNGGRGLGETQRSRLCFLLLCFFALSSLDRLIHATLHKQYRTGRAALWAGISPLMSRRARGGAASNSAAWICFSVCAFALGPCFCVMYKRYTDIYMIGVRCTVLVAHAAFTASCGQTVIIQFASKGSSHLRAPAVQSRHIRQFTHLTLGHNQNRRLRSPT